MVEIVEVVVEEVLDMVQAKAMVLDTAEVKALEVDMVQVKALEQDMVQVAEIVEMIDDKMALLEMIAESFEIVAVGNNYYCNFVVDNSSFYQNYPFLRKMFFI